MIPRATYRLQLHRDFGFVEATALLPYLAELGISHCYLSPYLKARAGSPHGYDIVDHNAINPELGGATEYCDFVAALRAREMGHILDLVPNHMGVGGDDNPWWLDVLEHGRASPYAEFFDIDWYPAKAELRERLLLPILADHYGRTLEGGELGVSFDAARGEFNIRYRDHRLPLDPRTYPQLLSPGLRLRGIDLPLRERLDELILAFSRLPGRNESSSVRRETRRYEQQRCKDRLVELCAGDTAVGDHIAANLETFSNVKRRRGACNALHRLLEAQVYRLTYWRVAADEINYRRFFAINDLAGLRMERPEVFEATHRLVLELVGNGSLDGLRIDHPDGLYDPAAYFHRLSTALAAARSAAADHGTAEAPCYLVAEKILAAGERLPDEWPLHGTTGYDFANEVNGLFLRPEAARELERIYRRFSGVRLDFDELLYRSKRLVMEVERFAGLESLSKRLVAVTETDRNTRDYTANSLRNALKELIACFPVYRTYLAGEAAREADRRAIEAAVFEAKQRSPAADISVFDVIRDLLLNGYREADPVRRGEIVHFTMCFQQYTAPITAKALEDTCLYNDNRLLSLNEVGGDPRRFGCTLEEFHAAAGERLRRWPAALLATSTHDSKRSEDVRARLNVLSEIPVAWKKQLGRWSRVNRRHRRFLADGVAPSRNDEYFLYQTLLGSWPLEPLDDEGLARYRLRIQDYMMKAIREAKARTSWVNRNLPYEEAVGNFVERLLAGGRNTFLLEFIPFAERVSRLGLYNSLSQTLIKLTVPGVPDIYQGCELWAFNLVDPDNRRPVNYDERRNLLREIEEGMPALPERLEDGRVKLYLIRRLLDLRRWHSALFAEGEYLPLTAEGERAEHLCAFARLCGEEALIVVAPRWFAGLCGEAHPVPVGEALWGGTQLLLPEALVGREWTHLLDGGVVAAAGTRLSVVPLLARFPLAAAFSEGR